MATAPPKSLTNTTSVPPITITSAAALPPVQPANGTCATRCAFKYGGTGNTFRYDLESAHLGDGSGLPSNANLLKGLSVCVPCDYSISGGADAKPTSYGAMVCAGLFKNPVRFFLNNLCVRPPAGTLEITTDIVCGRCAPSIGVATLIPSDSPLYDQWWTQRATLNQFQPGSDGSTWGGITCRYSCPAGFTSNNENPTAYAAKPCVECSGSACGGSAGAFYLSETGTCGAAGGNIAPYFFVCVSCDTRWNQQQGSGVRKYLFQAQIAPVAKDDRCVARCNPAGYQGFNAITNTFFDGYMAIGDGLQCTACQLGDANFVCGGGCGAGHYNTSSAGCALCNTSLCPASTYRPLCHALSSTHDAGCLPCVNGSLQNRDELFAPENIDALNAARPELVALARDVRGHIVRRWISADDRSLSPLSPVVTVVESPHPYQCAVACINNYAWVNVTSGRSPFLPSSSGVLLAEVAETPELFCLPCASLARLNGSAASEEVPLYAVWNDRSNVTLPSNNNKSTPLLLLQSMAGVDGGCGACGSVLRDVIASSTRMCELMPGYASDALTWQSTFVTVRAPIPDVAMGLQPITVVRTDATTGLTTTVTQPSPSVVSLNKTATVPPVPSFLSAPGAFDYSSYFVGRRRALLSLSSVDAAPASLTQMQAFSSAAATSDITTQRVAAASTTRTLLAVRLPFFQSGMAYLACCDRLATDPETARRCRAFAHGGDLAHVSPSVLPCALVLLDTTTASAAAANVSSSRRRRRLLQQQPQQQAEDGQACPAGGFKAARGDAPCSVCANGGSTMDMASASGAACLCQPGWYAIDQAGNCALCVNGTKRGPLDAACVACDADKYTPGGDGAADCVCLPGTYINPLLSLSQCVPCEHGYFCAPAQARQACPQHSTSPARAASLAECVCEPAYYAGDVGVCYPRPPGATAGGGCAANWTARYVALAGGGRFVQCTSPCPSGSYALLAPSTQLLVRCVPCDVDTYAVDGAQAVDGCTPCPIGRGTRGRTGATSADNCTCTVGVANATSACAGCAANHFYDLLAKQCLACPDGQGAPANTVGFYGCQCLPGTYATGATCSPCPLGSFSHSIGLVCTQCPPGCTTDAVGQTTLAACRCTRSLF